MTLPANIRINLLAPFPSLVEGINAVTVGKQNGIWQVGLNAPGLGIQNPPPAGNLPTDYLIVYDSVAQQYIRVPLSIMTGAARGQRSVTASPIVVASTDQILNVNINTGTPTCTLPSFATRNGVPLTFVDIGAQFFAHPLEIIPAAGEVINGLTTGIVLNTNNQVITLTPLNDGVNQGWFTS